MKARSKPSPWEEIGGPRYLGPLRHPAIGIRIPEIFLTGILRAYKRRSVAGGLMLSFGRETATERVINAPQGMYEITMGHTGTSIKKYMTMSAEDASKEGVIIEIEADHLIIVGSSAKAVKRIAGIHEETRITPEELERSIAYNREEIDEAVSTGVVNAFTTDTSDLIDHRAETWNDKLVQERFEESFSAKEKREFHDRYVGREFIFPSINGGSYKYCLSNLQLMRLALKFKESIRVNREIYDYIKEKMNSPFGFEISLDETTEKTRDEEILFYLSEWKSSGAHADFVAPNIGFKKRQDFNGNLKELEALVARQAAIARYFGALLSIHSGSGTTPHSGKGSGTYRALLNATGGNLKYKISGVYFELLLELLASFPSGSKERELYNNIFDAVYEYLCGELERGGSLASEILRKQIEGYERGIIRGTRKRRNPRATFFRFNSFLALNLRDAGGRRYFRDALVTLYRDDTKFHELVDHEVEKLTLRLIDGLKFVNNIEDLASSKM